MKNEKVEERTGVLFKFFGASGIVIGGLMVLYHLALHRWIGASEGARSAFGDQFGAFGVWLTGVSFFGLMLSVVLQSKDLRSQTRALELQQEALQQQIAEFQEQKEEMRRAAGAQEQVAKSQDMANRIAIAQLAFDRAKLRIESSIAFAENSTNTDQRRRMLEQAQKQAIALEKNFPGDQFDEKTAS